MLYIQGLFKLIYLDPRPIFLNKELNNNYCICDYGKPSGHSLASTGITLLLYYDLKKYIKLKGCMIYLFRFFLFSIVIAIILSRIHLGVHSINQCVIGALLGITIFFFIRRTEDALLKYMIWPIFYKDRFKFRNPVALILCLMIFMNYVLFLLWAYVYTEKEYPDMSFINFENCHFDCAGNTQKISMNFSGKTLRDALGFNVFFGLLLGILLTDERNFSYKGLYADGSVKKYLLRLFIFLLFFSLLILVDFPKIHHNFIALVRAMSVPIIVGILLTSTFFQTLHLLRLDIRRTIFTPEQSIL